MIFFLTAGLFLAAVALILVIPIWSGRPVPLLSAAEASMDEERVNLGIEKQAVLTSLSDLEVDFSQEKLSPEDFHRLKLAEEHRLLKVLQQIDALAGRKPDGGALTRRAVPTDFPRKWLYSVLTGLMVLGGTAGAAYLINGKIERSQRAAGEASSGQIATGPNPLEMVARVEKRLKENPNNLEDQLKAGRAYMVLERWADAEKAWRKVIELDERNDAGHYYLADVLLRTAPPGKKEVYEEALGHIEKALINQPRTPIFLWAKGVALLHLNRFSDADEAWTAAYQNLPRDSEDAEFVKKNLQELRAGKPRP